MGPINQYPSGEKLLSPYPIWVFIGGSFYCGIADDQSVADVIRTQFQGAQIVFLRANAPINLKIPNGTVARLRRTEDGTNARNAS